ncbi:MAG: alpha/beta hydrolase [Planctomycetota bacterium]
MPPSTKRSLLVLVHGTFAGRRSQLGNAQSAFAQRLRRHLGQQVRIVAFPWSGCNSHLARRNAGDRLKQFLYRVGSRYEHVYLIGHSHGGNIIRYAASLSCVTGIACLSTPLIDIRPREIHSTVEFLTMMLCLLIATLLLLIVGTICLLPSALGAKDRIFFWLPALWAYVTYMTYKYRSKMFKNVHFPKGVALSLRLEAAQDSFCAEFAYPQLRSNALTIRYGADEPTVGLRLLQFVASLPGMVLPAALGWTVFVLLLTALLSFAAVRIYATPSALPNALLFSWIYGDESKELAPVEFQKLITDEPPSEGTSKYEGMSPKEIMDQARRERDDRDSRKRAVSAARNSGASAWYAVSAILWIVLCSVLVASFGAIAVIVIHQACLVLVPLPIRSHVLGFGGEGLTVNWLNNTRVRNIFRSDMCAGGATLPIRLRRPCYSRMCNLAHSFVYWDPRTIRKLVLWIREDGRLP